MSKINEVKGKAQEKVKGFLSGKPIWIFWLFFTCMIGIVFAIVYAVITFLSLKWWFLLLVIVIAGMASGTFAYLNEIQEKKSDEENN
ncbi:MAG TPA: hypothetical protein VJ861_13135 [Treponemataceae bacterium]|nr:hypothetical protein [Treponemataceae bacterium]